METNLGQQTPKLNVTNISSAVFGKEEGAALGGESSIGKLARILRTTRLKVNEVEKSITGISAKFLEIEKRITLNPENITGNIKKTETNAEKITRLKNIIQNQKSNIGEKLPGSTEEKEKAKLNTTLTETNRILVEIQKQLAYDFAMRVAEDKQEVAEDKEATSKERFKREESALEKSAKAMVSTVKTATKKVVSPIGNIFQKLLAFIGILGKGIALNAAFEWFKDPKNREKITKFFNILKQNWKLLRNILLTVVAAGIIVKVVSALTALGGVLAFLASPIVLKVLAAIAAGVVAYKAGKFLVDGIRNLADGGENFTKAYDQLNQQLEDAGMTSAGVSKNRSRQGNRRSSSIGGRNEEQEKVFKEVSGKRDKLKELRKTMDSEVKTKQGEIDYTKLGDKPGTVGAMGSGTGSNKSAAQAKVKAEVEESYIPKIQSIIAPGGIEGRAMGGPVTAKSPYLVGEAGPEIFTPNVDGSVINNMRTEKIYQMLASGKKGRTRIVELPPQTIEGPKPEIKMPRGPATKAPKISSSNSLDGYRSVSSGIYGIMV